MSRQLYRGGPSRGARLATGLGALSVLVGLIAGLPLLLRYATTLMLPNGWTPLADLPDALMATDGGSLFAQAVIGLGWCVWAVFAVLVVWEIGLRLVGRHPPVRTGVRTPQGFAGILVAAVAALATSPVSSAHAAVLPTVIAAAADPVPDSDQTPPADLDRTATYVHHLVERGEGLLDLEDKYGVPWQRIAEANYGVEQPDGKRLEPGRTLIYPGWQLRIPTTPITPAAHATEQPDDKAGPLVYEVAAGDWLWHIAGRYLGDEERYLELAALNPQLAQRYGDEFPDHIEPGDRITLPDDARDRGIRRHATGSIITVEPPHEQQPTPPAEEPIQPPEPAEATTPPPTTPAAPATPTPAPTTTASPTTAPTSSTPIPATPGQPTHQAADPTPWGSQTDTSDDEHSSTLVPIAFGAALITATLAGTAAVKLRRRAAAADPRVGRRGHRPGHRPRHVAKGVVEQQLYAAAQPLDIDRLDAALRSLATGLADRSSPPPDIVGVHVTDGDLHLLLADTDAQPPPPWRANSTLWTLTSDEHLSPPPGDTLAVLPALVTVGSRAGQAGTPTGGEHLLLDLERVGCLCIEGDPATGGDLLRYLASELSLNSWADDVEVICAGWPRHEAGLLEALNPDRVRAAGSIAEQASQLRQRVRLAVDTLQNAGAADALAGRVYDLAGDSWMPTVLLAYDPQPNDLEAIADLVTELAGVGRCAVAVVTNSTIPATNGQPTAAHTITVTEDRTVHVPFLNVTLAATGLPVRELEQLAQVIAAARDGAEEPVPPAPEPEPWAAGTDAAGALLIPADAPDLHAGELAEEDQSDTAGEAGPLEDLSVIAPTSALTRGPESPASASHTPMAPPATATGEPAPAPAPIATARAEADPSLDEDLAVWYRPVADRPRIRVLGPVVEATAVIDAPGQPPKPGRLLLLAEVLVYLAQRGQRGASPTQLDQDLWPGQEVQVTYRRATISRARSWAGRRADGSPWLAEVHYKLENGYLLDWHLFRRLRARGQSRGHDGIADLRAALELVRGMPLAGYERIASTTRTPYNWLPTSDIDPDHLIAAIVDTAHELAQLYLSRGDTTGARWAVDKAWQADPDRNYDQPWHDLLRIHAHEGHLAELQACVHELMRLREAEVEEDLDPAIYTLLQKILPASYWDRTREPAYQD